MAKSIGLNHARDWLRNTVIGLAGLSWNLRSGLRLEVRCFADWVVYCDIFADGEYDEAIDCCIASSAPGRPMHILDLGANVGLFAFRLADRALRADATRPFHLTMVEGSPRIAAELQRRIRANPPLASRATVVHGLVGRREGVGTIRELTFHAMSTTAPGPGRGVSTPFVDLDAATRSIPVIDLLKCDIEGSEQQLLQNYPELLAKARIVVIELHPTLCDADQCRHLLENAGLTRHRVSRSTDTFAVELWRR